MSRFLVTAIGSFSAPSVISVLHQNNNYVCGTDIYPQEWHHTSKGCDNFYQVELAVSPHFINQILEICYKEEIDYIIPLTDVEIDTFCANRDLFEKNKIKILMPPSDFLKIARNKFLLSEKFKNDNIVLVPPYILSDNWGNKSLIAECDLIAKPVNGRSSEGLIKLKKGDDITTVISTKSYIIQDMIDGPVITVDYVRDIYDNDFSIPRRELIRTKNGAGTTVEIFSDNQIKNIVSHIGHNLGCIGCVNMEFIYNNGSYYLIDINPRFSAGVAFSIFAGYNMVLSHILSCTDCKILDPIKYNRQIIEKVYKEVCNIVFN